MGKCIKKLGVGEILIGLYKGGNPAHCHSVDRPEDVMLSEICQTQQKKMLQVLTYMGNICLFIYLIIFNMGTL
jgi:hypothetical protein